MTIEQIKKGLQCCLTGNRCQYETNKECPYRISDLECKRPQLLADVLLVITDLEDKVNERDEMIKAAAKALGYDCDQCDRW